MAELRISTKDDHTNDLANTKAGVVFIDKDGYALLICQKDNNIWSLPRGSVKVGESTYDGACREMLEESGLNVKELPIHSTYYFKLHDIETTHYVIISKLSRNDIHVKSEEISSYWWVNWSVFKNMKSQMKEKRVNHPTTITLNIMSLSMKEKFSKNLHKSFLSK